MKKVLKGLAAIIGCITALVVLATPVEFELGWVRVICAITSMFAWSFYFQSWHDELMKGFNYDTEQKLQAFKDNLIG